MFTNPGFLLPFFMSSRHVATKKLRSSSASVKRSTRLGLCWRDGSWKVHVKAVVVSLWVFQVKLKENCFKSFFNSNKHIPFWKKSIPPSPSPMISACQSSLGVLPSAYGRWEWGSVPRRRSPPSVAEMSQGVHQLLMLGMVIPPFIGNPYRNL